MASLSNSAYDAMEIAGPVDVSKFDYAKQARAVNEARAALNDAFAHVHRRDEDDPRTRRWLDAIAIFNLACERAYPNSLREVVQGLSSVKDLQSSDMLDFLEADPMFFRSGYLKEKLLREIKQRKLNVSDRLRLQRIIIDVVQNRSHRREFFDYCRAAVSVDDPQLRRELGMLEQSSDERVGLRASLVSAALDGKWAELKAYSRRSFD